MAERGAFQRVFGAVTHDPAIDFLSVLGNQEEHRARLERYRINQASYRADHWTSRFVAGSGAGRGYYDADSPDGPLMRANWTRRFADKLTATLFKHGFEVQAPDVKEDGVTTTSRTFQKDRLEEVWEANKREVLGMEIGQSGVVCGDAFVHVSNDDTMFEGEGGTRLDVLPGHFCFPDFGGAEGRDRRKMNSCLVLWPVVEGSSTLMQRLASRLQIGKAIVQDEEIRQAGNLRSIKRISVRGEWIFPDRIWEIEGVAPVRSRPNPLGMVNVVHIPNIPIVGETYGYAEVTDLVNLTNEWNEKATDVSDVVNYHGSPLTVLTGARLAELERGPNRIWALPQDADIKNLEIKGDLGASITYLKLVKEAMHELTGVPYGALASDQDASGREAGVALSIRYAPLLEIFEVKSAVYGRGIEQINDLILRFEALRDPAFGARQERIPARRRYHTDVTFFPPLPRDEARELEVSEQKLRIGLSTRSIEARKHGNPDSEDPQQVVEESRKERIQDMQDGFAAEGDLPGMRPLRRPASPGQDTKGERISDAQR